MRSAPVVALGVIGILAAIATTRSQGTPAAELTPEQWREDLRTMARELPRLHQELFHTTTRAAFDSAIGALDARIPSLGAHEVMVEMARIVATVKDGHTEIPLLQPASGFHLLPIALYRFGDSLYIIAAGEEHRALLGARVLRIGSRGAAEAMALVEPLLSGDNEIEPMHSGPSYLASPEVLHALDIVADRERVPLEVELPAGERTTVVLAPRPAASSAALVSAREARAVKPPLFASRPGVPHWATYLPDSRTVYFQFNLSANLDGHPSASASTRTMLALVDQYDPERLVIDVRNNNGGNIARNRDIIDGVARRPQLREHGRLFVVTGRRTFSAGLDLVLDLKKVARPILVGEPSRGAPWAPGNREEIRLPNSRLRVDYSQKIDLASLRRGAPRVLPVDVVAPPTIEAFLAGRDPAMEAVLAFRP